MEKLTSKLYSLNFEDLGKGLVVSVVGAILAVIEKSVEAHKFDFDWQTIGQTALAACVAYLVKNFFSPQALVTPVTPPAVVTQQTILTTGSEAINDTGKATS